MTRSEAPDFLKMLTALGELFGAKLSGAAQTMYFNALRDLSLEEISDGVANCSRKLRFMPKPTEIRENITSFGAASCLETDAAEAWQIARSALSHFGSSGPPKDWNPAIKTSIEAAYGSWRTAAMGEFSYDVLESKQRAFIAAWKREELDNAECARLERLEKLDAIDRADGLSPALPQKLFER